MTLIVMRMIASIGTTIHVEYVRTECQSINESRYHDLILKHRSPVRKLQVCRDD